jgi:hypothetical protein
LKYPDNFKEETLWRAYNHVSIQATLSVDQTTILDNEMLARFNTRHLFNIKKAVFSSNRIQEEEQKNGGEESKKESRQISLIEKCEALEEKCEALEEKNA